MRELVIAARKDHDAKLKILKSFEPLIKKCFTLYIKDYSFFDDAMQEGYIAILKCIDKFDINSGYEFPGYVKVSVIHSIRQLSRNIEHYTSIDKVINEDGGTLLDLFISSTDIEAEEIEKYNIKALHRALTGLTVKQRKVIDLIYFKNLSMQDICRARRCHYMAVVRLKNRALQALRKELAPRIK